MSAGQEIIVRNARTDDLKGLIDLHLRCFTPYEHLAVRLGKSYLRSVYRWFITSPETIVLVAEPSNQKGRIVGFVTVSKGPYHRLMLSHNKSALVRSFLLKPWLVFHPVIVKRIVQTVSTRDGLEKIFLAEDNVAYGGWLGIDPDYRRTGLGWKIMVDHIDECRARGWTKIIGIHYKGNEAMRRVLTKLGYKELSVSSDEKSAYLLDMDE